MDLQATPKFLLKCVQLYETLCVRHGVMLIGETMVGKSCIRNMLNAALGELAIMDQEQEIAKKAEREANAAASAALSESFRSSSPGGTASGAAQCHETLGLLNPKTRQTLNLGCGGGGGSRAE